MLKHAKPRKTTNKYMVFFLPLALSERKSFPVLHGQYKYSSLLTWSLTEEIFYRPII